MPRLVVLTLSLTLALAVILPAPLAAQQRSAHTISFTNKCSAPILVAINHKKVDNSGWEARGWFELEPNTREELVSTRNNIFYYSAHGPGRHWIGTDAYKRVRGEDIPFAFRKVDIGATSFIDYNHSLACPSNYGEQIEEIRFVNHCRTDLKVWLRYQDRETGEWRSEGWFTLKARERHYLRKTQGDIYYYHLKGKDGYSMASKGGQKFRIGNGEMRPHAKARSHEWMNIRCR